MKFSSSTGLHTLEDIALYVHLMKEAMDQFGKISELPLSKEAFPSQAKAQIEDLSNRLKLLETHEASPALVESILYNNFPDSYKKMLGDYISCQQIGIFTGVLLEQFIQMQKDNPYYLDDAMLGGLPTKQARELLNLQTECNAFKSYFNTNLYLFLKQRLLGIYLSLFGGYILFSLLNFNYFHFSTTISTISIVTFATIAITSIGLSYRYLRIPESKYRIARTAFNTALQKGIVSYFKANLK